MKISLFALQVLDAINRNGSFAGAANELQCVRSAITYTIQKLEQDLEILIYDRTGHRAKLTPAGQALLDEGKHLLQMASDLEQLVKQVDTGWETEFRIAYDDTIAIESLFLLIEKFYKECPNTRLNITAEVLGGCWDALISGRANLAIGVSGDTPATGKFGMKSLGQMKFVFAISPNHPLAKLPEPLKNSDIIKYRAIIATDSSRILAPRSSGSLQGQDTLTVSSLNAKIKAQIASLGVGYLPVNLIQEELNTGRLIVKEVEKVKSSAHFSIAWNLHKKGKAMEWFLKNLENFNL